MEKSEGVFGCPAKIRRVPAVRCGGRRVGGLRVTSAPPGKWAPALGRSSERNCLEWRLSSFLLTYLGIQIFRFYFKCTKCCEELTINTDPQNLDYVVEDSAQRNFEPWRDKDEVLEKEKVKQDAEELGHAMKSLENRTQDSKQKMNIMAALDDMKSMKVKNGERGREQVIKQRRRRRVKDSDFR